jgi:hypothetical protein
LFAVVFIVCWLPHFCFAIYRGICTGIGVNINMQVHKSIYIITVWFGYAHSVFNPIIYTLFNRAFRRTLLNLFVRVSGCRQLQAQYATDTGRSTQQQQSELHHIDENDNHNISSL